MKWKKPEGFFVYVVLNQKSPTYKHCNMRLKVMNER